MTRVQKSPQPLTLVRTEETATVPEQELAAFAQTTAELAEALKKRAPVDLDDMPTMVGAD